MCQLEKDPYLSLLSTAGSNRGIVGNEEYFVPLLNETNT